MLDESRDVNPLPPIDRQTLGDQLRNFFYPTAIFAAIAAVWAIGWASSVEAKAAVGYWSASNLRTANERFDPSALQDESDHEAVTELDD